MATATLAELDVVAVVEDIPLQKLLRGQVGTVVAVLNNGEAVEVEFVDRDGHTYAVETLRPAQLLPLRFQLTTA